ncbi:glycosyltransferase [Thalassospira sp.]|uniref:glycosyltransferase n=1 Tax=Thalassospira sp. TaxID=1912094 RepID=UPI0027347A08|nr:glycosyltransferase [Thalassospira sp.]MDP2696933.1 glycosyltransferase [Thalassospira sp.]
MRLIAPKARLAWNAVTYASWAVLAYCLLAIIVTPDVLSLRALGNPDVTVDITRRLKPLGSFLVFAAVLLIADGLDQKGLRRWLSWLFVLAVPVVIYVGMARANAAAILAMLGIFAISLVVVVNLRRVTFLAVGGMVISIVAVVVWLGNVTNTSWGDLDGFQPYLPIQLVDVHRQIIWHFAFERMQDHPLIGWGINAAPWIPGANDVPGTLGQSVLPAHPHSWFIEIWLETGIIGLLSVLGFLVVCGGVSFRLLRQSGMAIAVPILAVQVGYWFSGLFNYSFWSTWWQSVFLISLLLLILRKEMQALPGSPDRRSKMLFVCGEDWSFVSHRIGLGRAALVQGWDVVIACRTGEAAEKLRDEGFRVIDASIVRGGLSPISSLNTIKSLACLIRREQPDVVVNVSIQCVVLSAMAGLIVGAKRSVNMITGLGFMFVSGGVRARIVRSIVSLLLRFYALFPSVTVIVQNADDRDVMAGLGFPTQRLHLIRGSGVDLLAYDPGQDQKPSDDLKTVIFVARMLWSKGLAELVEAARLLKSKGRNYRFWLVGDADPANPDSADDGQLRAWQQEGLIEWLGRRRDVADLLRQSDLAVLPSWREGLPKSLLEAAAAGLAMVATDVPGCREIVLPGKTGLLVPLKDAQSLAEAIDTLLCNDILRAGMGWQARKLVEDELCDAVIIARTMEVIGQK